MQCDHSVGFGGSPNERGEVTLDAMIMNGRTMQIGAVANLKKIKHAVKAARLVMDKTYMTLLAGNDATEFATKFGLKQTNLSTEYSNELHKKWIDGGKVPNYWKSEEPNVFDPNHVGHDTIGMVTRDSQSNFACSTSTNGLSFRIPGRVGDAPIPGSGCYVENGVGGAAATGLGDVLMRFLPAYRAVVVNMKYRNMHPKDACAEALQEVLKYEPKSFGGLVCVNEAGEYGAAAIGAFRDYYKYSFVSMDTGRVIVRNWNE
ncbi:glycosylasparaginase [Acrasis kona]|uniref:Glycosylasparaginase n=1 Tax=Acrasis kona TaxID=1008807 RepID=A0AAW2Z9T3_9EUKA